MVNSDVGSSAAQVGLVVEPVDNWFCAARREPDNNKLLRNICWFIARSDHDLLFPDDLSGEDREIYRAMYQAYVAENTGFCLNTNMASGLIAREIERRFSRDARAMDSDGRWDLYCRIITSVISYLKDESLRPLWDSIIAHCQDNGDDVCHDAAMAMVEDLEDTLLNVSDNITVPSTFIGSSTDHL